MTIKIKHKRGTASNITSANPTLAAGELAFETDTRRFKVGDGTTAWSSLSYVTPYVTATDRILGRSSAGAGSAEEIPCTAAGRALLSGADAAAQRTTLSVQPTASPAFTGAATFTVSSGSSVPVSIANSGTGNSLVVATNFIVDGSGRLGFNAAPRAFEQCSLLGTAPSSLQTSLGFRVQCTFPSSSTSDAVSFSSYPVTQAASYTLANLTHFGAYFQGVGAGSTVTNQYGFFAESNLTGATNNYGFYGNIASGTGRWNFYANGTAASYFGGQVQISTGSASAPGVAFSGDTNTGIAQLSAAGLDTLSLIAGGTERLRVNGNGETVSAATFVAPSGDTSIRGSGAGAGQWLGICGDAAGFGTGPAIIMRSAGAGGSTEFYSGSSQGVIINSSRQLLVTAGSVSAPGVAFSGDTNTGEFSPAADNWAVATGGTERVRIDASGNVGVGNIVPTHRLDCNGEFRLRGTGASTEAGKLHLYWVSSTNRATWTTDASGNALIETGSSSPAERFRVGVNGRSQFFAANEKYGIQLNKSTTANGPFIGSDGADIFTVSASGGGELLRIDAGGNVLVNTTSGDPAGTNATSGCCIAPSSYISVTRSAAPCLYVNRKTDDGTIVSIHQDGTAEGSISVSGTTVSYNAFCGSHWAQLIDNSRPSILRGTVLETIDEMCEWPEGKSDRLVRVKVSDTPRSRRVYGVFMAWDEDYAATGDMYATALGAYMVRVSGTVQAGDLLESAGDGTARTQPDDIVRSSTIGKVSSTHRVAEYGDGSYLVPCVLMCG